MALVVVGLIGQGFEMKKIRASIKTDEQLNPKNVFLDKRNLKWYALIGAGLILSFMKFWFVPSSQKILDELYRSGLNIAIAYYNQRVFWVTPG